MEEIELAKIISFSNQKGGVGKTTSAVNVAASLGVLGYKVLLIDLDPQGNATSGVGIPKKGLKNSINDVLAGGVPAADAIIQTEFDNLDIIPANITLAGAEYSLYQVDGAESVMKNALAPIKDNYDYIIIDCSPSLGMMTLNALSAADSVIIPVQAHYLPAKCMTQLMRTITKVKKHINPKLNIDGILLTLVDNRTNLAKSTIDALRENFGSYIKIYNTHIPIAIKAAEVSSKGKSIYAYEPNSTVSKAYTEFSKEVLADGRKKERLHSAQVR